MEFSPSDPKTIAEVVVEADTLVEVAPVAATLAWPLEDMLDATSPPRGISETKRSPVVLLGT